MFKAGRSYNITHTTTSKMFVRIHSLKMLSLVSLSYIWEQKEQSFLFVNGIVFSKLSSSEGSQKLKRLLTKRETFLLNSIISAKVNFPLNLNFKFERLTKKCLKLVQCSQRKSRLYKSAWNGPTNSTPTFRFCEN